MTQKCLPCIGIQRLTPVAIFNRPGLSTLGYRVGKHADFFESMLAALSDAGSITGRPVAVTRVLDYLRTRDLDDPSIAMLDAWALIADVLTFYQERVANEAFLNTATQSSSLHELSRLLGYVPRPGLSSSVLLSFEVDDRSDEVIIPAGTPAKSTPLPGTPDQPQTFETSEAFRARAEWNRIRPRLTRPQQLQEGQLAELERVYVKGRGLRIEPNDWLGIGVAESLKDASLKQVRKVEERTDPTGAQVTVLHLGVDPLSVTQLLNEIKAAGEVFFDFVDQSALFESQVKVAFRKHKLTFNGILTELRVIRFGKGLIYVDSELQERLLIQQLFPTPGGTDVSLGDFMELLVQKISDIAEDYSHSTSPASLYGQALVDYKMLHDTVATDFVAPWKSHVDSLGAPNSAADRKTLQEKLYWEDVLGTPASQKPDLLIGTTLDQATVPDNGAVFDLVEAAASTDTTATEYQLTLENTFGIELDTLTETAADTAELKTKLESIKRTSDTATEFSSDIYYLVSDQANNFLTAGIHVIKTDDDNEPYFNGLRPEQVILKRAGVQLNHSVAFLEMGSPLSLSATGTDPDFNYQVEVLTGVGSVNDSGRANKKIDVLDGLLRAVVYTAPDLNPHRVVIKLTISDGVGVRAIAIRTLLIDGGPNFVRRELAESLANPSNLDALRVTLTGTQNELANIASQTNLPTAVALNGSIAAPLRQDLSLNSANQALDTAIAGIKRGLEDLANNLDFAFVQQDANRTVWQLAALIPDAPATSGGTEMDAFEIHFTLSANLLAKEKDAVTAVRDDSLYSLANRIKRSLHQPPRSRFVNLLNRAKTDHENLFADSTDADRQAKAALKTLFSKTSEGGVVDTSVIARVAALEAYNRADGLDALRNTHSKIEELYQLAAFVLDQALALPNLSAATKEALDLIKARWERTKASVSGTGAIEDPAGNTAPTISTAQDILKRLLATGGDLSVADALLVLHVLNQGSHLWTQMTAALNPSLRDDILAGFRDFRNISLPRTPRIDIWVFRSQANVFGWNSPGKLDKVDLGGGVQQLVMNRDSGKLDPKGEEKDLICLDGKFEDTLAGTPIAIRKNGQSLPEAYWVERVAFAPRTEYELSGDTTQVKLLRNWWDELTSPPVHADFAMIRGTKVWCNAEPLDLAESILSDDASTYRLFTPESFPSLELNKFHPFLSAGMKLVISGIPAPDMLPPDNRRPQRDALDANLHSELATIVRVSHDFQRQLYDDPVRTTVTLLGPLERSYWRDTVEVAANIVLATHGETVRETIGSGDARQTFQKFTLSKTPLTRLPAADADGQQPQLEVRVNNVQWQPTDRLLDHDQQAEIYEIQASRTAANRIQFGDGVNGSRVPTGQGNVQAMYRTGIGQAGNVETGRIDQLPSPPLGVRGVSNPVGGEGGADPDTVRQTKPRIPRAPIRAARLISRRDYESFALLFAGVDKAKAILEHGAVRLIIAGVQPGPLREEGLLLQSLKRAIDRFADPNVPVIVGPHSGKLLFVKATLNIDERADWEVVKDAAKRALAQRFSYENAQLGQAILASDVVNTIQNVQYVRFARIEKLDGFTTENINQVADQAEPSSAVQARSRIDVDRHELCYVADSVDNTIVLEREL